MQNPHISALFVLITFKLHSLLENRLVDSKTADDEYIDVVTQPDNIETVT